MTPQPTWATLAAVPPGLTGAQAQERLQAITDTLIPAIVAKVKERGFPAGGLLVLETTENSHRLSCVSYEAAFRRAQERGPATIHALVSAYALAQAERKSVILIIYASPVGSWATASLVIDCTGVVE